MLRDPENASFVFRVRSSAHSHDFRGYRGMVSAHVYNRRS
jgi:hypothetical protein